MAIIKRPGSGRTKGAVSHCTVTLKQLNRKLKPSDAVPVSRIFADGMGFQFEPFASKQNMLRGMVETIQKRKKS